MTILYTKHLRVAFTSHFGRFFSKRKDGSFITGRILFFFEYDLG